MVPRIVLLTCTTEDITLLLCEESLYQNRGNLRKGPSACQLSMIALYSALLRKFLKAYMNKTFSQPPLEDAQVKAHIKLSPNLGIR
jgi:hypothetical protein